jgi:hypothetical protein
MDETQIFLTVQEAAEYAEITEQGVRNAIYRGKLVKVIKYGRTLIAREEIERYRLVARRGRPPLTRESL